MFIFVNHTDMKFYGKRIRVRLAFKMELQRGKRILDQMIMLLLFTETAAAYMCIHGGCRNCPPLPTPPLSTLWLQKLVMLKFAVGAECLTVFVKVA